MKPKKRYTVKVVGYMDQETNKMTLKTRAMGNLRFAPEGMLRSAVNVAVGIAKEGKLEEIHKSLHEQLEDAWSQAVAKKEVGP